MITQDPLIQFLKKRNEVTGGRSFEGGEHLWLGHAGAEKALKSLAARGFPVTSFGPFARKMAPEALTYGEIVAFSGDFYETPDDLFNEKPARLSWLYEDNDLDDLLEALRREVHWINLPSDQRGTRYPDENIVLWWNAKRFIELGLQNTSHFGWHNALAYATWHEAALTLAQKAAMQSDSAAKSLLFRHAVYTNGFADHFLTDGFAAGHVRSPAAQLRNWAHAQGMSDKLAGALLKLIHDQDGHVHELHGQQEHRESSEGLHVVNSRGEQWWTRCDGQLFVSDLNDLAVTQAVGAVAVSVEELLDVYNGAAIPAGVFRATQWIPWPHPDERSLVEKFPADIDDAAARRLHESIKWYVKLPRIAAGIQPKHIQVCFKELPKIMQQFRDDVAQAVATSSAAIRRLAPELISAFKEIR